MDTAEIPAATSESSTLPAAPSRRLLRVFRAKERSGQAIVEFALVSMAFFTITLGTIDLGRAVYQYQALTNAVREGARVGKMDPGNGTRIKDTVIDKGPSLGLTYANISEDCGYKGCYQGCAWIEVEATVQFKSVLQHMLDIPPIDLTSKARVETE